jgi:hypothetical protein
MENKMKIIIVLLCMFPLVSSGIEPLIIKLEQGGASYTVPSNKVLVIEHVLRPGNLAGGDIGFISAGVTHGPVPIGGHTGGPLSNRTIKIPSSTEIYNASTQVGDSYVLTLFCLLVDPVDLYAHINSQSGNRMVANDSFAVDVKTSSPRPAKIAVKNSSDLVARKSAGATVKKKAPDTYTISIPAEDQKRHFAKYTERGGNL